MKKTQVSGICIVIAFIILSGNMVQAQIPRPEHPRPQFHRDAWMNLNGTWDFAIDYGETGMERNMHVSTDDYDRTIQVPFCPESPLSGIEHRGFMNAVWYHRTFQIPPEWVGKRIFLHFGAVDYDCQVWVNGEISGRHYGGSSSFAFEITDSLVAGMNHVYVMARDHLRDGVQPGGKQSHTYFNQGCCMYNRTTGIWQTVWLEARPQSYIADVRIIPDLDNRRFMFIPEFDGYRRDQIFKVTLKTPDGQAAAEVESHSGNGIPVTVQLEKPELWSPENPFLYDVRYELIQNGDVIDTIDSYAGMRKFHIEGNQIFLNNEPVFLRLVLDQGFYPDGVWTAPSDAALKKDIELSLAAGFNGARLHEKVFEERFHYWADKLGYLTWGEFPDWGMPRTYANPEGWNNLKREWREVMMRDISHPSILAWTPMNETHSAKEDYEAYRRAAEEIYDLTRDLDPARPVNETSGFLHIKTDLWTVHDYTQDVPTFQERYETVRRWPENQEEVYFLDWGWFGRIPQYDVKYEGQPYIVDEYGGTFWTPEFADEEPRGEGRSTIGYGKTSEEILAVIEGLTQVLLDNPNICGYTYTQLTDVDQEVNGIYTFDRKPKFDLDRLKAIFGAPAVVEKK